MTANYLAETMLSPGVYEAGLHAVKRERSKAGNDMTVLSWSLIDHGQPWLVKDYFVDGKAQWKVEQLARALGVEPEDLGPLSGYIGRLVRLRVSREQTEDGERNKISAYIRRESCQTT